MSESFLHYVWQYQYFNKEHLVTTTGENIEVFNPGLLNTHAGPDFQNTRVRIGEMEWVGSTEIHLMASGWTDHHHDHDHAYQSVVLHVVWKNDKKVTRPDGSAIPTLELIDRVSPDLILSYKKLVNSPESIPCAGVYNAVRELTRLSMLDRALMQRLEDKAEAVSAMLAKNNNDWEETCYQLLARNFGFKVNADPFLQLAKSMPYKILLKQSNLLQCEALLFGQAGFLDESFTDEYIELLQREYLLLSHKHQLKASRLHKAQWRFLRLRPANFPTIRIAQFAALLYSRKNIFSHILETVGKQQWQHLFSIEQSEYWRHHYLFEKHHEEIIPGLGQMSIYNILINTVVPLLVAYGKNHDEQQWIDRAVEILQNIPAEKNTITKQWESVGQSVKSAFDSQALIEMYNNLCTKRRCLSCHIGGQLLNPISN